MQLRDARTRDDFVSRIKAFAATVPAGTWITGGDWDHSLWGGELPAREWIDAVTPNHPVWINRLDGHMKLANGAALKAAGVTRATPDVAGGEIVRRADGEPTGLLKDNAMSLVDNVVPPPSAEMRQRAVAAAMRSCRGAGVTTVHDMSMPGGRMDRPFDLRRDAQGGHAEHTHLQRDAIGGLGAPPRRRGAQGTRRDRRSGRRVAAGRGLKGFVDGSLGSHTAAFHEPFDDAPNDRGLLINTPEELYRWISGADKAGLHVMVHALAIAPTAPARHVCARDL